MRVTAVMAEFVKVVKDYPIGVLRRGFLRAVDHVSLQIRAGEVFGLLGPNRAGKTTLVKLLLSLCHPSTGQVLRLGRPVAERRTLARVGYVHENHAFPRYLTATALLRYYGALSLLTAEQVEERVPRLLKQVGLADRANEPISRYSKGMVQRLGVAQALVNDPELLVLDEPGEGLDLNGRQMIRRLVEEQRDRGRAVLLVSHQLTEVEEVCDRVAVLVQGKVVKTGTVAEVKRDSSTGKSQSLETTLQKLYEHSPRRST
jgi:ABC-2 type transport system ATP-binding protein